MKAKPGFRYRNRFLLKLIEVTCLEFWFFGKTDSSSPSSIFKNGNRRHSMARFHPNKFEIKIFECTENFKIRKNSVAFYKQKPDRVEQSGFLLKKNFSKNGFYATGCDPYVIGSTSRPSPVVILRVFGSKRHMMLSRSDTSASARIVCWRTAISTFAIVSSPLRIQEYQS